MSVLHEKPDPDLLVKWRKFISGGSLSLKSLETTAATRPTWRRVGTDTIELSIDGRTHTIGSRSSCAEGLRSSVTARWLLAAFEAPEPRREWFHLFRGVHLAVRVYEKRIGQSARRIVQRVLRRIPEIQDKNLIKVSRYGIELDDSWTNNNL